MIRNILIVIGSIIFCVLAILAPLLLGYGIAIGWKFLLMLPLYIIVFVEFVVLWVVVFDEGTKNE